MTLDNVGSEPVALQVVENVEGDVRAIAGAVELVVNPVGNVAIMKSPSARSPVAVVVKSTVHTDAAFATNDVGAVVVNESPVTLVAALSDGTAAVGLTGVVSCDVDSEKVFFPSAVPFRIPTLNTAAVEFASTHVVGPLFARVIFTVPLSSGSEATAVQSRANDDGDVRVTAGVVVTDENVGGNVNWIVDPVLKTPDDEVVKPHVQTDAASFTNDEGGLLVTDTSVTAVAVRVAPTVGATAAVSEDVATEKLVPPYAPAGPLIMATVNVAAVMSPSASE
jgi:hypothetical protein